ncbi:hypothetical protein M0D69_11180 [Caballeronia sp. SEWSISQ10-4 2]|uniref:hypothetical protein n=1 Tax=Caballeronia sp. SEWSISQ10-4 2 TaxID=2937438 RepID=UPI0026565812|nr:hypothetical protein [Caballeronia sp. SEWSISQ10-4 2]MDN7178574.1 hypothetical protein [Caballeronia sp. SEWSISQ10-4 2]
MTLPSSGAISMSQIANEVGLSLPVSINHPWLLLLAGKAGFPVSFSDFYGRTGRFDANLLGQTFGNGDIFVRLGNTPFFGGALFGMDAGFPDSGHSQLLFSSAPNWPGNLLFKNNTTGVGVVLSKSNSTTWLAASNPANLIRTGITDSFTVVPSN